MSDTLTVNKIGLTTDYTYEFTQTLGNNFKKADQFNWAKQLTDGILIDTADQVYVDHRTLAGGANETLDLTALSIGTVTPVFARVKFLAMRLAYALTQASSIQVGAAAANPFVAHLGGTTPTFQVRNGGFVAFFTPDATAYVSGAAKNLKVLNNDGANTATYDILIIGASA